MNIREHFTEDGLRRIAERMDNQTWFRMVVFVVPPLVVSRIINLLEIHPLIQTTSTLLVFGGFAAFLMWPKVRARIKAQREAEEEEALLAENQAADGKRSHLYKEMMDRMSKMSSGDMNRVHQAIDYEFEMNADGDYGHAIETAFRRMRDRYNAGVRKRNEAKKQKAGAAVVTVGKGDTAALLEVGSRKPDGKGQHDQEASQ